MNHRLQFQTPIDESQLSQQPFKNWSTVEASLIVKVSHVAIGGVADDDTR